MPPHNIDKSAFRKGEYSGYTGYGLYEIARSRVGGWRARLRESDRRSEYYANGLLPSEFEGRTLDEVSRELDAIRRGIEESGVSFALERDTLGNPHKRRSNPAFTTGELQRMQREVDRLLFPDGLSGKPKARPKAKPKAKPTASEVADPPKGFVLVDTRDEREGFCRYTLIDTKPRLSNSGRKEYDAISFTKNPWSGHLWERTLSQYDFEEYCSYVGHPIRLADLPQSAHMAATTFLQERGVQPPPYDIPSPHRRKANPYHGTPAPPNSLMAKGEFVGVVRVDELDRLKKSADAPLMCYVFISGQGYQVRKFKSREALRKAVTESGSVGPANEFPHYWKEMVPPVVSYRRGR